MARCILSYKENKKYTVITHGDYMKEKKKEIGGQLKSSGLSSP